MSDSANDCLFCRIVAGDVPATVVAQSESALAFRDISPQAPTHVLVVPRVHHASAAESAEADPAVVGEMVKLAGSIAAQEGLVGYRMVFNTGAEAGQTVFHTHLHLIGGRSLTWPPG